MKFLALIILFSLANCKGSRIKKKRNDTPQTEEGVQVRFDKAKFAAMVKAASEKMGPETRRNVASRSKGLWVVGKQFSRTADECFSYATINMEKMQFRRVFACEAEKPKIQVELGLVEKVMMSDEEREDLHIKPILSSCIDDSFEHLHADTHIGLTQIVDIVEKPYQFDPKQGLLITYEIDETTTSFSRGAVVIGSSSCDDAAKKNPLHKEACRFLEMPASEMSQQKDTVCLKTKGSKIELFPSEVKVVNE